jgi:sterol 14alpha-demethylase
MTSVHMDLTNDRRKPSIGKATGNHYEEEPDMISNLMSCAYKNGQTLPEKEIAHVMITLLMGSQHSSSSASA